MMCFISLLCVRKPLQAEGLSAKEGGERILYKYSKERSVYGKKAGFFDP
jgi:hypothetical protein